MEIVRMELSFERWQTSALHRLASTAGALDPAQRTSRCARL